MTTKKAPPGRSRGSAVLEPIPANTPQRFVDGVGVVDDVPMPSPLPARPGRQPVVFAGFRILTLADGSTVHGCGECPESTDFTGTLAEVRRHRIDKHNMRRGGIKKKVNPDDLPGMVPLSIRMMPVGELLDMARELEALGDLIVTLTTECDEYKARALEAEQQVRRWERAFASIGR